MGDVEIMTIIVECYTCGEAWEETEIESKTHACKMAGKLSESEQIVVNALMMADGCDHFCCGLSDKACRARNIDHYLRTHDWK
jgi:hypothetical protein